MLLAPTELIGTLMPWWQMLNEHTLQRTAKTFLPPQHFELYALPAFANRRQLEDYTTIDARGNIVIRADEFKE